MPLKEIVDKILSDARTRAEEILGEGRKEADVILERASRDADLEKKRRIEKAERGIAGEMERDLAMAQLGARKEILAKRRDLIDEAFEKAIQEIIDGSKDLHRKIIQKILSGFKPEESYEIIVHKPDQDEYTIILSSLWGDAFTRHCQFKTVEKSIGGGFMLRSADMEYDCTFRRLIRESRQDMEQKIVGILFSDNDENLKEEN